MRRGTGLPEAGLRQDFAAFLKFLGRAIAHHAIFERRFDQTSMSTAVAARRETPADGRGAAGWQAWIQAALLAALLVLLYHDIVRLLVRDWLNDPNFSHGFFVPLFSAFVIWEQRDRLKQIPMRPAAFGLVIMAGALFTLVVCGLWAELFLSRTSLILLLCGMVIYYLGWAHLRAMAFPLAFLIFMVPLPSIVMNEITFPLQFLASKLASGLLSLIAVPVLREGNVINLPAMSLEVAEACSGIRSLSSLIVLAIIYGHFMESRRWARLVLMASAVPIAVIANALRILGTGACVQYWDPDKAEGFFHTFSGWLVFMVAVGLLLLVQTSLKLIGRDAQIPSEVKPA